MTNLKSMNAHDPLLQQTLWTGKMLTDQGEKIAILQTVYPEDQKRYVFELFDPELILRPPLLTRFFIAIRVFSLTASATPGLIVLGVGVLFEDWHADAFLFLSSLLSVTLLQIAVNIFNDVQDHLKGVDLPGDIGGSGVIQKGWFSAKTASKMACVSFLIACVLALFPLFHYPKELLAIGLCGLIGGLGYSGFGLGLKYRALGDIAVFLLCGPLLTTGFSIATFGKVSASVIIAGLIFGLGSVAILHANNLNDLEIDANRGARTVANQIGFKWSQKYLAMIYFAIFASCIASAFCIPKLALFFLAPTLVAPFVYRLLKKVDRATGPLSPSIAKIRFEAAQIHLLLGLAWLLCFFVHFILN